VSIWNIFPRFGILDKEKSGNPVAKRKKKRFRLFGTTFVLDRRTDGEGPTMRPTHFSLHCWSIKRNGNNVFLQISVPEAIFDVLTKVV
jgi:hypothetical protein